MTAERSISLALAALSGSLCLATSVWAQSFQVVNLVSDDPVAHPAQVTDRGLINAWGLSYAPAGPFWVSSNGTGTSTLYSVDPLTQRTTPAPLVVRIPPGGGPVTGQVFNTGAAGGAFNGDSFLFVGEDGTISGWNGGLGTQAEVLQTGLSGNVYKGVAIAGIAGNTYLYAANFASGRIDVSKGSSAAPALTGTFDDPVLPSGYAPFNIQNLGGTLYVAYAKQASTGRDEVAGPGLGFVDAFTLQGGFIGRIASQGALNAPWGLAIAPSSFGALAGALLVGNFGDGRINAYDPVSHAFKGAVTDASGSPLVVDGLWAIAPGNGAAAGSPSLLYFTAGPDDEAHGLFGVLTPVPEPGTAWLWCAGLALWAGRRKRAGASP